MKHVLVCLDDEIFDAFLTPRVLARLASRATVTRAGAADWTTHAGLADADVVVTGWGSARLTADVLARAPRLRGLVHTGGSVRGVVDPAALARPGFVVSSQVNANAAPVAAHAAASIIFAMRGVFDLRDDYRRRRGASDEPWLATITDRRRGLAGRTLGIVSASRIGRQVMELLRPWPLNLLVYDPYADAADIDHLGATLVPDLAELAGRSDVLSIHTPLRPETRGLVSRDVLAAMRDGATVINTARGAVVDEPALVAELVSGRLSAVLDVTDPEPPAPDSPLWDLDNVFLTPHIAGSLGTELEVLGAQAVDEALRVLQGEPLLHEVSPDALAREA
ncbi:hydroxyacid dehydrogenase [Propionibacteriaceae bacterium G1746]